MDAQHNNVYSEINFCAQSFIIPNSSPFNFYAISVNCTDRRVLTRLDVARIVIPPKTCTAMLA